MGGPTRVPPKVFKGKKEYPIHCTCPGPEYGKQAAVRDPKTGKIVERFTTHNPIKEGTRISHTMLNVHGQDKIKVTFVIDMNFYTDKDRFVGRIVEVKHG